MFSADLGGYTAPLPAATDPPFQKVALLLHGDGTNGAQNNTFVDYSYPGGYAVSFDGSGDYLSISAATNLNLGVGDFTVECWVHFSSYPGSAKSFLSQSNVNSSGWALGFNGSGSSLWWYSNYGAVINSSIAFQVGMWNHVAVVRSGSTLTMYVNGVSAGSATNTTNYGGTSTFYIGSDQFSQDLNGYISNARIVKGTALYTSNFTPSNQPLTAVSGTSLLTCQSATIVDNSPNAFTITANGNAAAVSSKTITRTGNVAQGTFSPFSLPEGQWSNYFDGTGDYLSYTQITCSGDFTVEAWVYSAASSSGTTSRSVFAGNTYNTQFNFDDNGAIIVANGGVGVTGLVTVGTAVTRNTWHHLALVRSGSTMTAYVDGVSVGSGTSSATAYFDQVGRVNWSPYNYMLGYISNARIVSGTALYTSNFTPPTSALTAISGTSLLTCQSNRFKDNSSNNFTITPAGDTKVTAFSPFAPSAAYSASTNGGSAYFDGTGDYLSAASSSSFDILSGGDFTVECWFYANTLASNGGFGSTLFAREGTGGVDGWGFRVQPTGLEFVYGGLAANTQSYTFYTNTWYHVVAERVGTTLYYYINGVRYTPTYTNRTTDSANALLIGVNNYSATKGYLNGYMCDGRIVKGTAVYSGATITVPTAPLTAVANTQLLLNCTNAGIFDNAGKNDIETVGNAQISTSVKKYGTGSMYFDGTGDYLVLQNNPDLFAFGSGDFTIEFWVNAVSFGAGGITIYDSRPSSTNGAYPAIYIDLNGSLRYYTASFDRIISGSNLSTNTWYHIALCRSNTSTKMFVNGTQTGSTYSDTNVYANNSNRPVICANGFSVGSFALNGYIDDLRITKGQALYTANFIPPTQAFPDV